MGDGITVQLYGFASVTVDAKYLCLQQTCEKARQPAAVARRANGYQNGKYLKNTVVHERLHTEVKNDFTAYGAG